LGGTKSAPRLLELRGECGFALGGLSLCLLHPLAAGLVDLRPHALLGVALDLLRPPTQPLGGILARGHLDAPQPVELLLQLGYLPTALLLGARTGLRLHAGERLLDLGVGLLLQPAHLGLDALLGLPAEPRSLLGEPGFGALDAGAGGLDLNGDLVEPALSRVRGLLRRLALAHQRLLM
jgi:hypothetical protein